MPVRTLEKDKLELIVLSRTEPDKKLEILSKKNQIYGYICHCKIQSPQKDFHGFGSIIPDSSIKTEPVKSPMDAVDAIHQRKHVYRWKTNEVIDFDQEYMKKVNEWRHKNNLFLIILVKGNGTNKPEILKIYDHKNTKFIDFPGFN